MESSELEAKATSSVSLVVVNFNAGTLLADCIASAIVQAKEIIVVDNASTDNSVSQLKNRFPEKTHLRVINNNQNLGFATACNIGTNAATGRYLLFLNPERSR